jgi:putative peptidoglycan binding protein
MKIGSMSAILLGGLWTGAFGQTGSTNATVPPASAPVASVAPAPTMVPPQRSQSRRSKGRNFQQPRTTDQQQTAETPQQPRNHPQASGSNDARADRHTHKTVQRPAINYSQAVQRQHRERHDRGWWKRRYTTIVFVNGCGHYYWDAGYWFPAWGYDPQYENYPDNGPIYTYGNLLPDQVIYNVQAALRDLGYYSGPLTGSMSGATRNAITAFQEDNGLDVTGAIDAPTVEALGLY